MAAPSRAGDRLRRAHHGRNRGGLCESRFAAGGMGSRAAGGQGEEFIYLLEDLTPDQVQGLGMEELKAFLQEQLRNAYDLKEGQIEQQRPGLMQEAERTILQQIDTLWREHLQAMDALRGVGLRGYGRDPKSNTRTGLRHVPGDDDQHAPQCDLFDVHVPALAPCVEA